MSESLTVSALAGVIAPVIVAVLSRAGLRDSYKRLVAIAVTVVLAGLGMWALYAPDSWAQAASVIAAGIGVTQTVYTALKPLWDYVEDTPVTVRRGEGVNGVQE